MLHHKAKSTQTNSFGTTFAEFSSYQHKPDMNKKTSIQMIADYEGDVTNLFNIEVNEDIPVLATRNMVLFPGVISPILIGRKTSINLINHLKNQQDATLRHILPKECRQRQPAAE